MPAKTQNNAAAVEPPAPGHVTLDNVHLVTRAPPRDDGPRDYLAELRRGISYTLARSPRSLVFEFAIRVPVTAAEKAYLERIAIDSIQYVDLGPDGLGRVQKVVQKFFFYDAKTGERLPDAEVESRPEVVVAPHSAYERYLQAMAAAQKAR